jgi:type I restriction enzyme S subunit
LLNQRVGRFEVVSERSCDPDFLYYTLRSPDIRRDIEGLGYGSAQPNVSPKLIQSVAIPLPSLDEQRAIASVLDALDDKIEQSRRTVQTLEKLARAIFRAWFVDFEPVKAKAAGATRFPPMPQAVFDALPTTFVDSDIGPVPEGWAVGTIKDLASISKAQVKPQEHPEENFDHFSIPAFDAGMRAAVDPGNAIKSNKFLVADGCVLLSKLNPRIARVWLPPPARDRRQIASTEFLVFVPREASGRHYLYCQFQQREFREELAQGASGTSNSHQRVRPKDVLSHPIVMPAPSFRKAFAHLADPLFALQLANRNESVMLAEVRDYLLPRLLSGSVCASHPKDREARS